MKNIIYLTLLSLLISCSATEEIYDDLTSPDYVSSSKARRLEVPPDLSELEQSESYSVPGEAKSYKEFLEREKGLTTEINSKKNKKLISNPEGINIVKSGNLRWLVVQKNPDIIWPYVKEFWEDLGFRVVVANKRTGIIETEWMDTQDLKLDSNTGALSTFDRWLDSLSGFADKRKFRTRVEYGDNDSTEIYVSQRSAEAAADQHARILRERTSEYNISQVYRIEEYKSDGDSKDNIEISESRQLDDYEIDSELLTRLMIKLGATDFEAKQKVSDPQILVKAKLIKDKENTYIQMLDPFDRSWRRLGLALDIIGFVTEDKNRSEGIYYVRFSEINLPSEKDDKEKGIIDSLIFWDHDEKVEKKNDEEIEFKNTEEDISKGEKIYTGVDVPEVEPIDEDYIVDEYSPIEQKNQEETWLSSLWPSWGSEEEINSLPDNEKRYRIRIKPIESGQVIVYLDFPSGKKNNSAEAKNILKIIYEHLK